MPLYIYKNPLTERVYEVIQGMNDTHRFFDPETGEECKRVWTKPNASVDSLSKSDPFDIKDHVEKTGKMKGTVGDLWDVSREMSERRADKIGAEDPMKREAFNKYEKEKGVKHWHDRPNKIDTNVATIDFTKPTPKLPEE